MISPTLGVTDLKVDLARWTRAGMLPGENVTVYGHPGGVGHCWSATLSGAGQSLAPGHAR
jgi:hypothetical protein